MSAQIRQHIECHRQRHTSATARRVHGTLSATLHISLPPLDYGLCCYQWLATDKACWVIANVRTQKIDLVPVSTRWWIRYVAFACDSVEPR